MGKSRAFTGMQARWDRNHKRHRGEQTSLLDGSNSIGSTRDAALAKGAAIKA